MKTNETLDGSTAGLIAAIANALGRNISAERMKELIANPEKLRMLLLPVASDPWIGMLPIVNQLMNEKTDVSRIRWVTITVASPGTPPTMRRVLREAYDRNLAPLEQGLAQSLWDMIATVDRVHAPHCAIVYRRNNVKEMNVSVKYTRIGSVSGGDHLVDFDYIDDTIVGRPFVFIEGHDDRSNCFKC